MLQKLSRNDRCHCGSGKKYKHCCLRVRAVNTESRLVQPPLANRHVPSSVSSSTPQPALRPTTPSQDWQDVQAILELPSGEAWVVVAVYSRKWLRTKSVTVGSPIPLNIPKFRIRGEGRVQSIRPSQMSPQGEGLVLSIDHLGKSVAQSLPSVEQRNWQQVHVRLDEPGDKEVYAVLLHSREWLDLQGLKSGGVFPLDLPQQQVRGKARIALIEPSPMRSDGEGRVVTFVRGKRKTDEMNDPLSRPGVRTYFGERLPAVGQEWVRIILSRENNLTSDLRLTRSTDWMQANWSATEELRKESVVPSEVAQWRLVHVSVAVQGGQKVHIAFFWQQRWVEAHGLTVGEPVLLRLPNESLSGEGQVTAIDPAPFVPGREEPHGRMFISGKQGSQNKGTIETMEVGDYVVTYTQQERGDRLPIDNTQGKWVTRQRIRLRLDKEDGGHSKIVFLRDAKWVRAERAVVGGTLYLNMPDMGCVGHARVEAVEPYMVFLRWGNSSVRMVTGTFAHSEGLCGELKLKGEPKPIGVTAAHPFWSVDREDWVPVGELLPGETVKTIEGTTTVESYTMCDKPEPVFNMEVEGDHCYRVGDQGILVHNSSNQCDTLCQKDGVPDPGLPDPKPAVEFYAELYMKDTIPIGTGATSKFTSGETGQIVKIIALNRQRNGGVVKSDDPADPFQILRSGPADLYREEIAAGTVKWEDERMRFLVWVADGRRVSLVTLPGPTMGDERRGRQVAVVDHIRPKDGGGSNSYCNARVISKALNSIKGNR